METRKPTREESRRWIAFRSRFDHRTSPMVKALVTLANLADEAQNITGTTIIDAETAKRVNDIGYRARIMSSQIDGVLLKNYFVQIDDTGALNIVANQADEADIYPTEENLGIAPILIGIGIAVVTLLIAGDQHQRALEKEAKVEAIKLQRKMVEADLEMMSAPAEKRKQWESWKKTTAKNADVVAKRLNGNKSWMQRFVGERATSMLVAAAIGVAALYILLPQLRRN